MTAFCRRTKFAAPIVITLVTGCGSGDKVTGNPPLPEHSHNPPAFPPLKTTWQVTRATSGECWAEKNVECEPGASCNPPPPRQIECPAEIADNKPMTVTRLDDGSCAVVPDGCTNTGCVASKTACPK